MADDLIAGRYRLLEPLGRGAMSAVWLAEDEELQRRVAVKTLAPSADRARFEREARAAASLSHPNICALYDYGEAEGRPYMVLEYLPGGSLEERLADREPLPDADTLRIATELAAGLAHAHERGLVHRDLKPANVLFDAEGRAKIADFGIARMHGTGTLTEAGTVLGTASYISPEQAAGEPAGPGSDVYSFGVILFRMLTGRLPFEGTNAMELVRMHRDDPPPSVTNVRPDAPPRLAALADASLAKDPRDRPADGTALLRELRGVASGEPTIVVEQATQIMRPPAQAARRRKRAPTAVLIAAVPVLLAAGIAVAVLATHHTDSSPAASLPNLTLPTVGRVTTPATTLATTQPTTTQATTTAATTTAPVTTPPPVTAPVTTALPPATTAPATTAPVTTAPVTTAPPPVTTTAPSETTTDFDTTATTTGP